jgi:hypothetical protein
MQQAVHNEQFRGVLAEQEDRTALSDSRRDNLATRETHSPASSIRLGSTQGGSLPLLGIWGQSAERMVSLLSNVAPTAHVWAQVQSAIQSERTRRHRHLHQLTQARIAEVLIIAILIGLMALSLVLFVGVPGSRARAVPVPVSVDKGCHRSVVRSASPQTPLAQLNEDPSSRLTLNAATGSDFRLMMPPLALSGQLSTASVTVEHLCPDLVVPESTECTLLIPKLPLRGAHGSGTESVALDLSDQQGRPVFHMMLFLGRRGTGQPWLRLDHASEDRAFAVCCAKDLAPDGSVTSVSFHDEGIGRGGGTVWGVMRFEQPSSVGKLGLYVITSITGWRVVLEGDFQGAGAVNATAEDSGKLLAIASPEGEGDRRSKRLLRLGPGTDAGLLLLAVLAVDLLEAEAARRRAPVRL